MRLFLVHRADLGQSLSKGCRGDVVQEVTLVFGGRMSPSLSTLRDNGALTCPLGRVEKWVFASKTVEIGLIKAAKHKLLATSDVRVL